MTWQYWKDLLMRGAPIPPEDWQDTGEREWRTYEEAGEFVKQYRAMQEVRFPDGALRWKAATWEPMGGPKLRVIRKSRL